MRRFTALCCSLLAFVALTGSFHHAWSQEVTASITGTITDPSGAAVAGATVTATSQERGQTYTGTTNESGLYRIAQLPVGSYAIKVEKAGFALASVPPFVLTLNQVARIDVGMKVGKASETVEVTGAAPVLETDDDASEHDHQCRNQRQSSAGITQLRSIDSAGAGGGFDRSQQLQ